MFLSPLPFVDFRAPTLSIFIMNDCTHFGTRLHLDTSILYTRSPGAAPYPSFAMFAVYICCLECLVCKCMVYIFDLNGF